MNPSPQESCFRYVAAQLCRALQVNDLPTAQRWMDARYAILSEGRGGKR